MQTLLIIVAFLGSSLGAHPQGAQGTIGFNNIGGSAEQKVYIDEWLNPAALVPAGEEYLVALYFAPLSAGEGWLTQVGPSKGFLGFYVGQTSGIFAGGSRTVTPDNWGGAALFQVKGWEAAYGNTYEEAAANSAARRGESPVFIADTSNPQTLEPIEGLINSSQSGPQPFRGFVIAVPEPSTGLLLFAGLGGAVVMIWRKGKRASAAHELDRNCH